MRNFAEISCSRKRTHVQSNSTVRDTAGHTLRTIYYYAYAVPFQSPEQCAYIILHYDLSDTLYDQFELQWALLGVIDHQVRQ